MTTKSMLEDEIRSTIEELSNEDVSSEKYKKITESLTKLIDKYNEMDKLELEYQDRYDSREAERDHREAELAIKEKQLQLDRKDVFWKHLLTGVSVVGCGLLLPFWGAKTSLFFEYMDDKIPSSITTKDLLKNVLPKRRG